MYWHTWNCHFSRECQLSFTKCWNRFWT